MDFSLERAKATAIKNMNFSNDSREDLASMAEELYEKYDEIEELKKQIEKLNAENEIAKLRKLRTKINILKIPEVNTKQNLSLFSGKLPNFRDLMMKKKEIRNKVLFKT